MQDIFLMTKYIELNRMDQSKMIFQSGSILKSGLSLSIAILGGVLYPHYGFGAHSEDSVAQQYRTDYELLKKQFPTRSLLDRARNQDVVVVFGNTKSGKSTLINYLKDPTCLAFNGTEVIQTNPEDDSFMTMSATVGTSETLLPKHAMVDDLSVFDMPGLADSRGISYILLNASFIKQILELARSVRFIFVISEPEITASAGELFKKLIRNFCGLLEAYESIIQSSSVFVFTKSTQNGVQPAKALVRSVATSVVDQADLSNMRRAVNFWTESTSSKFFHMPAPHSRINGGAIEWEDRANIIQALRGMPTPQKIKQVNINFLLTDDVLAFLGYIFSLVMKESFSKAFASSTDLDRYTIAEYQAKIAEYENTEAFWKNFCDETVAKSDEVVLFRPLAGEIYNKTTKDFRGQRQAELNLKRIQLVQALEKLKKEWETACNAIMKQEMEGFIVNKRAELKLDAPITDDFAGQLAVLKAFDRNVFKTQFPECSKKFETIPKPVGTEERSYWIILQANFKTTDLEKTLEDLQQAVTAKKAAITQKQEQKRIEDARQEQEREQVRIREQARAKEQAEEQARIAKEKEVKQVQEKNRQAQEKERIDGEVRQHFQRRLEAASAWLSTSITIPGVGALPGITGNGLRLFNLLVQSRTAYIQQGNQIVIDEFSRNFPDLIFDPTSRSIQIRREKAIEYLDSLLK